jgi:hypothetical protein
LLLILFSLWALSTAAQTYPSRSGKSDSFTLSGSVVNSVTGEPIGHALVRVSGNTQRTAFSDGEGHFQFEGMPAGTFGVIGQKPGYFTEMELGRGGNNTVTLGPSTDVVVVKLSPHSVISGRVVDATGQPIEHVPVRLTAKALREGRRYWEARGQQQTDEDGRYRFGDLMPGTYYIAAGPGRDVINRILRGTEGPKIGYPSMYYPGVPDLASAAPIQLAAGQHAEAEFSMTAGPLYRVSGTVAGYHPQQGVGFQFWSQSGDDLSVPIKFDSETGHFDVDGAPPGNYTVKAFSSGEGQPLRGQLQLNVAGNVENLHLVLGPAISIPVVVKTESRSAAANQPGMQGPPVSVRLIPSDPSTSESYSTMVRGKPGAYSVVLQNVEPGKYSVELTPQGLWYVQSAQYGQTNLLYDDLTVASGGTSYPLEIVLRDDGPSLTGTVKVADGKDTDVTVVAVPEPASKLATKVTHVYSLSTFGFVGLAPGEYLIYAFDSDRLEYTNPDVLQAYASQAAHVTLSPNQKLQVALELIRTGDGE